MSLPLLSLFLKPTDKQMFLRFEPHADVLDVKNSDNDGANYFFINSAALLQNNINCN